MLRPASLDIDLPALLSSLDDSRDHLETATRGLDQERIQELATSLFPLEPA